MDAATGSRSLSRQESYLLSRLAAAGQRVFTMEDARAALADGSDPRSMLQRLTNKDWLRRIERGKYRLLPLEAGPEAQWAEHEYVLAAALVQPYYLAYATALHYYGYSERLPRPIWLATTRRKRQVNTEGTTYRFVTLAERKFFGFTTINLSEAPVLIAEREKAIVDGFDQPAYAGGPVEPAKALWYGADEIDLGRLADYSLLLGNRAATARLGYWLELLGIGDDGLLGRLEQRAGRNYYRLDPGGPAAGARSARWRIIANIPDRQLLEWREH